MRHSFTCFDAHGLIGDLTEKHGPPHWVTVSRMKAWCLQTFDVNPLNFD